MLSCTLRFVDLGTGEARLAQIGAEREGDNENSGETVHSRYHQLSAHRDQHIPKRNESDLVGGTANKQSGVW